MQFNKSKCNLELEKFPVVDCYLPSGRSVGLVKMASGRSNTPNTSNPPNRDLSPIEMLCENELEKLKDLEASEEIHALVQQACDSRGSPDWDAMSPASDHYWNLITSESSRQKICHVTLRILDEYSSADEVTEEAAQTFMSRLKKLIVGKNDHPEVVKNFHASLLTVKAYFERGFQHIKKMVQKRPRSEEGGELSSPAKIPSVETETSGYHSSLLVPSALLKPVESVDDFKSSQEFQSQSSIISDTFRSTQSTTAGDADDEHSDSEIV